ncbi:class 1 fructose-bisphosphatase [Rhizobium sp. SEMIA 4085]|uniref:Fructose-1,6-bisphosphatase class 1 n=1 Tax=Rhizobium gallicum bv. gallicum R602sp TaxID=1041138 RepID=A0A0B4XC58_9HYPH|nr:MULTISPECIES: class 1 fructose-bisphosphatase [Rhizobium]AJD45584.1 fructose-1,6-bisphosphatase 2 [Rhizobium gallicum bv. gallicum R602sp]NNH31168.1 class 1 fructose-bisphosphatase [Rhizobium sp. SEMIA 4085]
MTSSTLDNFLSSHIDSGGPHCEAAAVTIRQLACAAVTLYSTINQGAPGKAFSRERGQVGPGGDITKDLDVLADALFIDAMREAPVCLYASEELEDAALLDPKAPLAVAIDPLDGSSNIDINVSIGTIFSILPAAGDPVGEPNASFFQRGDAQLAAGFFIYGPQLALVLSLGSGTHVFVFSSGGGVFVHAHESVVVPPRTQEFAINASNYRHWDEAVRLYVDDCLKGTEGPREKEFNMRWIAAVAADAYRILMRGGVYLYPGDTRRGYGEGRLRLVYEANPIAFLIEQAGGAATDTISRILDVTPTSLHQRVPLVFGSAREVMRIGRYHTEPSNIAERAPLFSNRGLFRA